MHASIKKAVVSVAAAGAISVGGPAVAFAAQLEVPNVTGMTANEARETLYQAGFDNVIGDNADSTHRVTGTNPRAGTYADEETTIILIVPSD
ncbi:PASTA domain-containing protein [Rhodococcoides kyotonense]|uniref:PASTA domain-containing protein n=1 Tax=Rhodococcoides kyotonense TaxID=398843 RepID=A0A239EMN8_9NOCA|nr:PASTA domain-containing protein [Rhodococcus kyotonensis]SNS45192.1 PASTA domain-containing protein [Rhodococcus kyotonensis]